jgi:DNA-binding Lrp family transcriptional regulator
LEATVIRAYVLIQTQVGEAVQVAREVSKLDGVTSAEAVTGPYDVVAQAEAADLDQLGRLVAAGIHGVGGISRTITCAVVAL